MAATIPDVRPPLWHLKPSVHKAQPLWPPRTGWLLPRLLQCLHSECHDRYHQWIFTVIYKVIPTIYILLQTGMIIVYSRIYYTELYATSCGIQVPCIGSTYKTHIPVCVLRWPLSFHMFRRNYEGNRIIQFYKTY